MTLLEFFIGSFSFDSFTGFGGFGSFDSLDGFDSFDSLIGFEIALAAFIIELKIQTFFKYIGCQTLEDLDVRRH
jgi:hypothetical protein